MSTYAMIFVLICSFGTVIFNVLTFYSVWEVNKKLKEVERLRKEIDGRTTTVIPFRVMTQPTMRSYHIGDLAPGESKTFAIHPRDD